MTHELETGLILGAGQVSWSRFLALATEERIGLLVARIGEWEERAGAGELWSGKESA